MSLTSSLYGQTNRGLHYSAQSTITNKSRLKLLHKREEILQEIFSAVREPSTPLYKTTGYVQFLESVLTESFLYLMEADVIICSRKSDVDVVNQAAQSAAKAFKEISGRDIEYEVDGSIADDACVWFLFSVKSLPVLMVYLCSGAKEV